LLPDIQTGALSGDAQKQIDSIVRQLNEWARLISAETRVRTIKADDGSVVGMGQIPGTERLGFFNLDADGNLTSEWVGPTLYFYRTDGKKGALIGIAPDGEMDVAISIEGEDVSELYS
jgi:hypothetical protein